MLSNARIELAEKLREETGKVIGMMDAYTLLKDRGDNYDACLEYITSGQMKKDRISRGGMI